MPKKSSKVGKFILTTDNYYGVITGEDKNTVTVHYFDDDAVYGDEFFGDTVQTFPIIDYDDLRQNFLDASRKKDDKGK